MRDGKTKDVLGGQRAAYYLRDKMRAGQRGDGRMVRPSKSVFISVGGAEVRDALPDKNGVMT